MAKFLQTLGKIAFIVLLIVFAVGFFAYKQYWLTFFTLALVLLTSSWGRIKKLIVGKDKVEVQIPEDIIKREDKRENQPDNR